VRISKSLLVHSIRHWCFLPAPEDFTQIAQFLANCNANGWYAAAIQGWGAKEKRSAFRRSVFSDEFIAT
jgi:hypothetical protein